MADNVQAQIDRAYQLITNGQDTEALQILRPIVQDDPENAEAHWLIANADPDIGNVYDALTNVVRLDPSNNDAREQLDQIKASYPELFGNTRTDYATDFDALFAPAPNAAGAVAPSSAVPAPVGNDFSNDFSDFGPGDMGSLDDFTFGDSGGSAVPAAALPPSGSDEFADLFADQPPVSVNVNTTVYESPSIDAMDALVSEIRTTRQTQSMQQIEIDPIPENSLFGDADAEAIDALTNTYTAPAAGKDNYSLDDMFNETPGQPSATDDFDAMFNDVPAAASAPAAASTDLDAMFANAGVDAASSTDPLVMPTPAFAQQESKRSSRQSAAVSAAAPAVTPAPPGRSKRDPKRESGVFAAADLTVPDPMQAELDFNRRRRSPLPRILIALLLLVVLVGAGVYVAQNYLIPGQNTSPATPVASGGTTGTYDIAALMQRLNTLSINPTVSIANSALTVEACSKSGYALKNTLYQTLDIVADEVIGSAYPVDSTSLVVTDCTSGNILYRAAAPTSALRSYIDTQKADPRAYRAAWK